LINNQLRFVRFQKRPTSFAVLFAPYIFHGRNQLVEREETWTWTAFGTELDELMEAIDDGPENEIAVTVLGGVPGRLPRRHLPPSLLAAIASHCLDDADTKKPRAMPGLLSC
jgi:hypothetical protein